MSQKREKTTSKQKAIDGVGDVRRRRRDTPLIIGSGEPNQEALISVIREWLVPLLVREFLAERGIEAPQGQNPGSFTGTVYPSPLQGARGKGRVNDKR